MSSSTASARFSQVFLVLMLLPCPFLACGILTLDGFFQDVQVFLLPLFSSLSIYISIYLSCLFLRSRTSFCPFAVDQVECFCFIAVNFTDCKALLLGILSRRGLSEDWSFSSVKSLLRYFHAQVKAFCDYQSLCGSNPAKYEHLAVYSACCMPVAITSGRFTVWYWVFEVRTHAHTHPLRLCGSSSLAASRVCRNVSNVEQCFSRKKSPNHNDLKVWR